MITWPPASGDFSFLLEMRTHVTTGTMQELVMKSQNVARRELKGMNKAKQGWGQGRQEAQSIELGRGLDPTVAISAPPQSRDRARHRPRTHVIQTRRLCRRSAKKPQVLVI